MISQGKLRFAMIGAGAIAQAYAQAFGDADFAELVAVADVRPEAAAAVADTVGCKSYSNYQEMLANTPFDAAIVCTPPITHPEICIWLLENGVHVLCEKPLAIDSASAKSMLDAASRSGNKFTMASKFRFVQDVIKAKSIVESGILGEIILLENTFTGYVDMSQRWNSNPEISGGGVLIDNGTHSVDLIRYFLGPLTEIQAVEGKRVQRLDVEDTVRLFVRTERNEMGSIDVSWSLNKQLPRYVSIYGALGTVIVGWKESKYRRSSDDDWICFGSGYNKVQAFRDQIANFTGAINGQESLVLQPEDALASVRVVEAAYEALRKNEWVPVKERESTTV